MCRTTKPRVVDLLHVLDPGRRRRSTTRGLARSPGGSLSASSCLGTRCRVLLNLKVWMAFTSPSTPLLSRWDRYQDNHVGLVYMGLHLDDVAPTLVQNKVRRWD